MIDLNKEAEEYATVNKTYSEQSELDFIAGANSKYVQFKIIQEKIDLLENLEFNPKEHVVELVFNIKNKIKELQQQLKQLEDDSR